MIPKLPPQTQRDLPLAGFFERLMEVGFLGDIDAGEASRAVFSTDNSIYQLKPKGVLFPKGADDLKAIAAVLREQPYSSIAIAPRGGGTGTNGQSLTSGVVVDCSRHMTRVLHIDPIKRVAHVEAGVVKDQLNRVLKPYGLFFAPELSTSNRATIGGMVSTDACGQGSCLYGKTSNHVLGLRVVLTDGTDWWSRPLDEHALGAVKGRQDRVGDIHRTVERIVREKSDEITAVFPKLNRYMTGYDLAHVIRDDGRFDLNAVLCGSEGTLAIIAEAELNLLPIPQHVVLINIRYADFNAALEDARVLVALKVAAVETVDEKVLELAKGDIVWGPIAKFFPDDTARSVNGVNIVEVIADDANDLSRRLADVTSLLVGDENAGRLGYTIASDKADVEAIWSMRKRAVGLLGNVVGAARPVPFVEDTAVPPESLAPYIREFRALLDRAGLSYGMFGHVDAGVLHVRPALDLSDELHVPLVRLITDEVVKLTRKYGGVLWGEHGKGVRSEYVPAFFGSLYPSLQEIKRAFDPTNLLNPGKIATPDATPLLKIDEVPLRGQLDRTIPSAVRASFDNAAHCNGNGLCFDFDASSPMCPSFKATGDRRYSPKGRASLLREWLRRLAEMDLDPRVETARQRRSSSFLGLLRRAFNSIDPRNRDDFSHEVRSAMDTCLGCKACAGQCPVKINVPAFRSKFLELYYGRYLRPLKDPVVASIESLLPLLARLAPVYNFMVTASLGKSLMRALGFVALPRITRPTLAAEARRSNVPIATLEGMDRLSSAERSQVVVFVTDAFTANFDTSVVLAALELARKMGFQPYLSAPAASGKALHVHGYLGRFLANAEKMSFYLNQLAKRGVALVGIDPSMTFTYRSEYTERQASRLEASVLMPQEWLCRHLDRLNAKDASSPRKGFRLLPHCTERTNVPASMNDWRRIFHRLGLDLVVADVGCCGMAGTFGHEARNRDISEKLYAMSWKPIIEATDVGEQLVATGYSCRSQIKQIGAKTINHPIQVINLFVEAVVHEGFS